MWSYEEEWQMHTGTSTPLCAARSHSQQAMAVSMPCSVNIFRGDQHRWCKSRGSQSERHHIENCHTWIVTTKNGHYYWKTLNINLLYMRQTFSLFVVISKAAILNMDWVKASGSFLSRALVVWWIISLLRSDWLWVASENWIIPATYTAHKQTGMKQTVRRKSCEVTSSLQY